VVALTSHLLARAAKRNPLPEGTLAVAAGLVVAGGAAYLFMKIAGGALPDKRDEKAITQLWFITFFVAPGFFLPLEQEVGRAVSHRVARGQGGLPVVRRTAVLGVSLVAVLLVAVAALSPLLVAKQFNDSWLLLGGLVLGILGWSSVHLGRGVLSGSGRFGSYGMVFILDGFLRVVAAAVLAAIGVELVGVYGLLIGAPPLLALAVALRRERGILQPGPDAPWNEITTNLGWLLLGSSASAFLVNAGPLAANVLSNADQAELVADFAYVVLVSRIPLFLFQAVQAALLPKLSRLAALGAMDEFRAGFRTLILLVGAVGVLGIVVTPVIGPFGLKFFTTGTFGARDYLLLSTASAFYMVTMALAQAVIALHGHAKVGLGWLAALVAFTVTLLSVDELLLRVELALCAGAVTAAACFAVALWLQLAEGAAPDPDSVMEAALDLPLEP
jgi:O-antigen/teichoic acid export membrane protein